jgi:hypothetical protein
MTTADAAPNRGAISPWALVGVLCSVGVCPVFTIAGVLLGLRALVEIRAHPGQIRGRGLAWLAIVLGLLVTSIWLGGAVWWQVNVRSRMSGVPAAIASGQRGDAAEFTEVFEHPSDSADTLTFLQTITSRYGHMHGSTSDTSKATDEEDTGDQIFGFLPASGDFKWLLLYDQHTIPVTARFVLFRSPDEGGEFVNRFDWIRLHDEELGDLVYPPHSEPIP